MQGNEKKKTIETIKKKSLVKIILGEASVVAEYFNTVVHKVTV